MSAMPYKSDKQRRFMHWKAKRSPKMRAVVNRWDEEYGGKVTKADDARTRLAIQRLKKSLEARLSM